MAELRKLPIGIEDFEKIRQEDFYYVDKTKLTGKFVYSTQQLFLFYLYSKKKRLYTSEAGKVLPFTAMTLTRAVKQLEMTDLFLVAKDGVNKFIESKFKERFQGFEIQYVIIGGTACDLIMENEELSFRATKDVDIVLIVESITAEFGRLFWEYVKEAGIKRLFKM